MPVGGVGSILPAFLLVRPDVFLDLFLSGEHFQVHVFPGNLDFPLWTAPSQTHSARAARGWSGSALVPVYFLRGTWPDLPVMLM